MKFSFRILILFLITASSVACTSQEISPLLYKDQENSELITQDNESIYLDYTIDKVTLSKSYQSIEPSIEIIKNGINTNLLISLGIVNSSGINIDNIDMDGSDVNIHVNNENIDKNNQLVVPQIILHFNNLSPQRMEELNFKIINKNYEPIKSNIDISEAIRKIKSSLKIEISTFPTANIVKERDHIFLDLNFSNAIDLNDKSNPVINLDALIDLDTGEIVESSKSPVASFIDKGTILDYVSNKYIFYLKDKAGDDKLNDELYLYDIEKDIKEKIYTSEEKICCLQFNNAGDRALLINSSKNSNKLFFFELKDSKLEKIDSLKKIDPYLATWKDDDDIILVDQKKNESNIYNLNAKTSKVTLISTITGNIKQINYLDGKFVFTLDNDNLKEIFITKDFKSNTLVDQGEKALFIDSNTIAYFKNENNTDNNTLWFYDIKDQSSQTYTDINVKDFFIRKNKLVIIEKTQIDSDDPLYVYDLTKEKLEFITSIKSDKVYLNTNKNILYINSSISINDNKTSLISFINLEDYKAHQE